jgi:iron(III) transport system ATP-binding protein
MEDLILRNISKRYFAGDGYAVREVSLSVSRGEMMALIGESGSGKTTLLRLIAGFEIPDSGEMVIRDKMVYDGKIFTAPEKRGVGMVFQDAALFPHLSISSNIGFGLHKLRNSAKKNRIAELLKLVGLDGIGHRYPHQLSGGQQQRVALARALAPNPSLILLDEPFSSIDKNLKDQVRDEMRQIIEQTKTTSVFVTHDTKDALSIADRVAILRKGRLLQIDTPETIYEKPVCSCVAGFLGKTNLLKANVTEAGFETAIGLIPSEIANGKNGPVTLSIRPEHFDVLNTDKPGICAKVAEISFCGDHLEVLLAVKNAPAENQTLQISVRAERQIEKGQMVHVRPRVEKIQVLRA